MQPSYIRNKVLDLRKKGYSYSLIQKRLGVSKSTLSNWLRDIPFIPNLEVLKRIEYGPIKSGAKRHNQKVKNVKLIKGLAKKELGKISKRDLWMLGLGLYLGEGSKAYEHIRIINSDPQIMQLAVKWFREICDLKTNNFTIRIHLYPDSNIGKCLTYWSKSLKIPLEQFRKTQIDRREDKSYKKKSKLPYGTAHISIITNGNPKYGSKLHRRIMGWLEGTLDQI